MSHLRKWDFQHLWHPFTHHHDWFRQDPLIIVRGKGVRLQDIQGNWYYDGVSSIWLNVHGHADDELNRALIEQAEQVAHSTLLGLTNVPAILLARKLAEISPERTLQRVFFTDNGATAVECALKIAIQYWYNRKQPDKSRILGFQNAYHGDTLGAMAVGFTPAFHRPFARLLSWRMPASPYPYCYRCPLGKTYPSCGISCFDQTWNLLRHYRKYLAGVVVEPVQGAGGIIPPPREWLLRLQEACQELDILLIVDEVATGFGKLGTWFACERLGIRPDLLCFGKGVSGGYLPVAGVLVPDRIFQTFVGEDARTFYHGHSYTGNPLGCAVSLASIRKLEKILPVLPARIRQIQEKLQEFWKFPIVGDIRQAGFMVGIELVRDRRRKTPYPYSARAGWVVAEFARRMGLLIRPIGNVVIFMPPVGVSETDLRDMLEILYWSLAESVPRLQNL